MSKHCPVTCGVGEFTMDISSLNFTHFFKKGQIYKELSFFACMLKWPLIKKRQEHMLAIVPMFCVVKMCAIKVFSY